MPNSRFALHGQRPALIRGLCAFFASNSRFVRLFQAALDTCLDSPFFASLSVHGLHFTVYAPSIYYGAPNEYIHTHLMIWELISQLHRTSVTYGFLAGIILCNSGAFIRHFCECANWQLHTSIVWELIFFQLHTSVTHKNCF